MVVLILPFQQVRDVWALIQLRCRIFRSGRCLVKVRFKLELACKGPIRALGRQEGVRPNQSGVRRRQELGWQDWLQ